MALFAAFAMQQRIKICYILTATTVDFQDSVADFLGFVSFCRIRIQNPIVDLDADQIPTYYCGKFGF
jgi:hypothetical protein